MIYHREHEHPGSRRSIIAFLRKFDDCILEELLARTDVYLTKRMKHQIHKMQKEGSFRPALEIYQEQKKEAIMRTVGLTR